MGHSTRADRVKRVRSAPEALASAPVPHCGDRLRPELGAVKGDSGSRDPAQTPATGLGCAEPRHRRSARLRRSAEGCALRQPTGLLLILSGGRVVPWSGAAYLWTSSTRRFFAFPSSVELETTGASEATPWGCSLPGAIPCLVTSRLTTEAARSIESFRYGIEARRLFSLTPHSLLIHPFCSSRSRAG